MIKKSLSITLNNKTFNAYFLFFCAFIMILLPSYFFEYLPDSDEKFLKICATLIMLFHIVKRGVKFTIPMFYNDDY